MLTRAALFFLGTTAAANAACGPDQQTFVSCQIADRGTILAVCFDAQMASYSYGPAGQPELTLQEPVFTLDYTPWPGVGGAIWEEVTFYNGPYSYTVLGGFDRPMDDADMENLAERQFGGVVVRKNGTTLVELTCEPATVDYAWGEGLWDAKQDAGLSWNTYERIWVELPD